MTKTAIIALAITAAFIATALGASIAHVVTAHQAVADIGAQMDAAEAQQEAEAAAEAAKAQVEAEIAALQAVAEAAEAEAVVIAQPITAEWLDLHPFSDWRSAQRTGWDPIEPEVEIRTVTKITERIAEPVVIIAPVFPSIEWGESETCPDPDMWGSPPNCYYHSDEGASLEAEEAAVDQTGPTEADCVAWLGPGSVPGGSGYCTPTDDPYAAAEAPAAERQASIDGARAECVALGRNWDDETPGCWY